jgi:DNA-binding GntR family transcriptional regulator
LSIDALPRIPQNSRRHQVVQALREAIVKGDLRPGDRLVEDDLSMRLGTSRGPVREALRQLEHEGLVLSFPYRGTVVVGISQEEVKEVLVPIRLILERFAFRNALPVLSDRDFEELKNLVDAMERATEERDLGRIVEADVRFHELVISRSGQPHCEQIWRTIVPRVRAYFYEDAPHHESLKVIANEHRELLEILKTRDGGKVLAEVEKHVRHRPSFGGYGGSGETEVEARAEEWKIGPS